MAAAEVGFQDQWQHAEELGFAAVSGEHGQVGALLDSVERYVWSHPEVEVLDATRVLAGDRRVVRQADSCAVASEE